MPLPTPHKHEKKGEFVSRCMGDDETNKTFSDQKQRVAVCYSQWQHAKASATSISGSGDDEVIVSTKENVPDHFDNPVYPSKNGDTTFKPEDFKQYLPMHVEQVAAEKDTDKSAEFFITLLNSATVAHILHLQAKSYSEHKALQGLYEELPEVADDLIEAYQGKYQKLVKYPNQPVGESPDDSLNFVKSLNAYVAQVRHSIGSPDDTELQNIIDELVQLLDSTTYKLTFLK
jgi:Family of unknown function (DUF5856)